MEKDWHRADLLTICLLTLILSGQQNNVIILGVLEQNKRVQLNHRDILFQRGKFNIQAKHKRKKSV
jgi:hypothetical protein